MDHREYRPFLGCVEEARSHARIWAIVLICGIAIPVGSLLMAIAWGKGTLDHRAIILGVIAMVFLALAGYVYVELVIRVNSTSLTLGDDGLVYQVTKRFRGHVQVVTRIQSPWSEVRTLRERLNWWGGRAFRLDIDTGQGPFSFQTTPGSHDELKQTIRRLAPHLSQDDWDDALPGFGVGKTFQEYPEWSSWLTVMPILVLSVIGLWWSVKALYHSGLPPELRDPMLSKWVLGLFLSGMVPVLFVLMTPYAVWLRNYLDVAHDGIRRERCCFQWMPPKIHSTRTRVAWNEITDIRWIDVPYRGLQFDTTRGKFEFGQYLSKATNREIVQEVRRYVPYTVL